MKVQIDVVDKVNKGDLLMFDGKHFIPINIKKLLYEHEKRLDEIEKLNKRVEILELDVALDRGKISKEEYDRMIMEME